MRKRKRPYGEYVDEETGQVTVVQTTKQAKRAHQKSGKWYKEPTEAEIRAWDREEEQQKKANKALQREQNKKTNAVKRAEKLAKEQDLKRDLFEAGKITFTQTLAKKDEDQLNLHSWFGGRPKQSKPKSNQTQRPYVNDENSNNIVKDKARTSNKYDERGSSELAKVETLSQESSEDGDNNSDATSFLNEETNRPQTEDCSKSEICNMDLLQPGQRPDQMQDTNLSPPEQFEVAEDSDTGGDVLDEEAEQAPQLSVPIFKIPALPAQNKRPPLSPMSKSDINVRTSQTTRVSSLEDKLAKANAFPPPSTQQVRDILSGICTQDLADDLDDDVFEDKENEQPVTVGSPGSGSPTKSPTKSLRKLSHKSVVASSPAARQNSILKETDDSLDHDNIFAEMNIADDAASKDSDDEDFDDCGLDDATLLSVPATQLVRAAKTYSDGSVTTIRPAVKPPAVSTPPKPTKQPIKKSDSFAVDDLEEDDLQEALDQWEHSQTYRPSPLPSRRGRPNLRS